MKLDSYIHSAYCATKTAVKMAVVCSISGMILLGCKEDSAAIKEEVARFNRSADSYQAQGQFRAAILEARNAIQKDPHDPRAYITLANINNQIGAYLATQKMLESVVKNVPNVSIALADTYVKNNKCRSAVNLLTAYNVDKEIIDEAVRKQVILARCSIYLGDKPAFDVAIEQLKKIPNQKNEVTLLEAENLIGQGRIEDAQVKLDELLLSDAGNIRTLILLGNFALRQNQMAKAEDLFTKVLASLPNTDLMTVDKTTALSQLTESLIQQGKTAEAYRYQKILADANPDSQAAQQKFNEAMEFYRQGKFDSAQKILSEIREHYPQDKNTAMLLGLVQYQQGQDKQALELFDKFIDPETASPTIIQAAVLAKYRSNKMNDAVALLKESVESQPNNAEIQATYGLALLDLDPTSADGEKAIEKSLALNPKQQRLRLALAKRSLALNNKPQALAQIKKAYDENRMDLYVQQMYLKTLLADGQSEAVKQIITEFQKEYSGHPRSWFLDGWFKLSQKDNVGALLSFEKALSLKNNEERSLSHAGMAQVYEIQKQPQKAILAWQSLLQEDASNIAAYVSWLKNVNELNRMKEANLFLADLVKKTDKWQPAVVYAELLAQQSQFVDAIKQMDIAFDRSAKAEHVKQIFAEIYLKYGQSLRKENNIPEARIQLLKALNLFPNNMSFLANVIELEVVQKNIPEAQKLLDQFAVNDENAGEYSYLQAYIRNAEGKPNEALKLYLTSWNKKPLDIVGNAIYEHYRNNKQESEADKFVEDWVVKLPNSSRPALIKAVKAQEAKDLTTAVKWYEKVVSIAPNMPAALNNLAWIYYEQKNPKAVDLAKRAYQLAGSNAAIMDTYGWILVENNRVQEGIEILERAVNLAPTNTEIKDHLATAKLRAK